MHCVWILGIFYCIGSVAAEPACSAYHFQEQTLERVIKAEFLLQDFKKQFETLVEKVTTNMASFQNDIAAFRQESAAFQKQTTQSVNDVIEDMEINVTSGLQALEHTRQTINRQIETLHDAVRTPHVSFRARSPRYMTPSSGSIIVYQITEENLGSGYDSGTGVFTAPVAGVYIFSVNICSSQPDTINISIVKDGTGIVGTWMYDQNSNYCVTLNSHVVLEKGNIVSVKCTTSGQLRDSYQYYWNTFSGLLIHQ